MNCTKIEEKRTEKLDKQGETAEETTWTYTFKGSITKNQHVIKSERPLDFFVGEAVTPESIASAQRARLDTSG